MEKADCNSWGGSRKSILGVQASPFCCRGCKNAWRACVHRIMVGAALCFCGWVFESGVCYVGTRQGQYLNPRARHHHTPGLRVWDRECVFEGAPNLFFLFFSVSFTKLWLQNNRLRCVPYFNQNVQTCDIPNLALWGHISTNGGCHALMATQFSGSECCHNVIHICVPYANLTIKNLIWTQIGKVC